VLTIAVSFATFENICYLTQHGASDLSFLLIRGFGTGAMHIVCGAIVGYGLVYVWQHGWLKTAGTVGLLGAAITFHATYNLLIAYGGTTQYLAYALPVLTLLLGGVTAKLLKSIPQS
jgi:RsiW-degrading membrane proteinase PrsW (M82 family)